ncbi:MAG: hypothetical protein Q9222_007683, partial [Ikaeria aurantiellina]
MGRMNNNEVWAKVYKTPPDPNPKELYRCFMDIIQKIIDDHYGFQGQPAVGMEDLPRKRMVPVHRPRTQFWDIVESNYGVTETTTSGEEDSEESSDHVDTDESDEEWEDASEAP